MAAVMGMQVAWWWNVYRSFALAQKNACVEMDRDGPMPALTVIVAARNEESTIGDLLAALRAQEYHLFEVIVVDDNSADDTTREVLKFAATDDRVRLIPSDGRGKKAAVASGINAARYEVCVFTDADCRPGPSWLARHGSLHRSEIARVVVGYAPLQTPRSLLGLYQRYETEINAIFSGAAIGSRRAYMATGRNFSYTKALFEVVGGFDRHLESLSGDDDILLQDFRTRTNAEIYWLSKSDAAVESDGKITLTGWFKQKRRHTSAGRYFVPDVKLSLILYHGPQILMWSAPIVIGLPGLIMIVIVLAFQALFMARARRELKSRFPLIALPLLAFLNALSMAILPVAGFIVRPRVWGGRTE